MVKKIIAMVFVSLALLTSCSSTSSTSDSLASSIETEADTSDFGVDTSWTPAGFNEYDENVAWRWVERESDCSDCIYWHIQIGQYYVQNCLWYISITASFHRGTYLISDKAA